MPGLSIAALPAAIQPVRKLYVQVMADIRYWTSVGNAEKTPSHASANVHRT